MSARPAISRRPSRAAPARFSIAIALATQSDWHEYPGAGRYSIMVKIIDIFGNDTTKLAEVRIK